MAVFIRLPAGYFINSLLYQGSAIPFFYRRNDFNNRISRNTFIAMMIAYPAEIRYGIAVFIGNISQNTFLTDPDQRGLPGRRQLRLCMATNESRSGH